MAAADGLKRMAMDDYISREAALEALQDPELFNVSPRFLQILCDLPAADVEPVRHGRWERCFEDWRQQIEGDKCSSCGFEYYGTGIRRFHYCPNCGAKMEGGTDV